MSDLDWNVPGRQWNQQGCHAHLDADTIHFAVGEHDFYMGRTEFSEYYAQTLASLLANGPSLEIVATIDSAFLAQVTHDLGAPQWWLRIAQTDMELIYAARNGELGRAERALAAGASVEACDAKGRTALGSACDVGASAVALLLLENGADPNRRFGPDRRTPLQCAAASCSSDVVRALLSRGAEIEARDRRDRTALQCARDANREVLLDAGADPARG
jgi:hypothetical protein